MKIRCHSSTKKEELIKFVEENKGSKIEIHFENNFIQGWGDDDIFIYDTSNKDMHKELLEVIRDCYIHNIKTL